MYLLRDNPVKAPTAAIPDVAGAARADLGRATAWMLLLIGLLGGATATRAPASAMATLTSPAVPTPRGSPPLNFGSVDGQCAALPAAVSDASISCSYDAALTRLFTPRAAPHGTYRVFVSSSSLDKMAALLRGQAGNNSQAWAVHEMDPLEAFGSAGEYDQVAVARLYVGHRARVARGPVVVNGKMKTSLWLISPYPDATLTRLEPGTLIIEFKVPSQQPRS